MESSSLIAKFMHNSEINLKIFIGLIEVNLDLKELSLSELLVLCDHIENNYKDALLQILNTNFILNTEHVFSACYYTYNAFLSNSNISKSKNIELLLYLSTKRQIKSALDDFGINFDKKIKQNCIICLISPQNNLDIIYQDLKKNIKLNEISLDLNQKSIEKFDRIKNYFDITDNQLKVITNSYKLDEKNEKTEISNLENLFLALTDLIREKMILLRLEKIGTN
jgi:tRNA threonylcarbamoyladenosine modification (KEOPS) complex Cgi121 subunit